MTLTQLLDVNLQEVTPTRRSFVGGALKGTFAAAASTVLPSTAHAEQEQTFADWHKAHSPEEKGEEFVHSHLKSYTLNPSRDEIESIDNILGRYLELDEVDFQSKIKKREIIRSGYRGGSKFTSVPLDNPAQFRWRARIRNELKSFYDFLNERETPQWNVHLWKPSTAVKPQSRQQAHIFLAGTIMSTNTCNYKVRREKGVLNIDASNEHTVYGRYDLFYSYSEEKDRLKVNLDKNLPILIAAQEDSKRVLGSLLSETLHYMLRDATLSHIQEELNNLPGQSKRSMQQKKKDFATISTGWLHKEESVVHGLVEHYISENAQKLGFSKEKSHTHYAKGDPRYDRVPRMQKKIAEFGINWAYRGYKIIPAQLFKE